MNSTPQWDKNSLLASVAFTPLHPEIRLCESAHFPTLDEFNARLANISPSIKVKGGHSLQFVSQEYGHLEFEAQYEPRCYLKGEVPTRADNWHDLLNALVWLTFPKAKAAINARHYKALTETAAVPKNSQRGAVRDAITLLDESGVIVPYADEELADLLKAFKWKELFWHRREQVERKMGFFIFGHGLYEKALNPYIGMTGQGLLLPVQKDFFSWTLPQQLTHLDDQLAIYLNDLSHCNDTRELSPVPLLGIPGWTDDNKNSNYYDNIDYFRSGRRRMQKFK